MFQEFYPFKQAADGIYLYIKVTPKAAQNRIGKILPASDDLVAQLKIYVTAAAQDGKANIAVIELLAKFLGIAKANLSIIKGQLQPSKICLIKDTSPKTLLTLRSIG